jgi:hypothetical protein
MVKGINPGQALDLIATERLTHETKFFILHFKK